MRDQYLTDIIHGAELKVVDGHKPAGRCLGFSILCAGITSLLFSLIHFYPEYWLLSLFALVPFLRQVYRASSSESLVMGAVLASTYCMITSGFRTDLNPDLLSSRFLVMNALMIGYAIAVNRTVKKTGINPIVTAILWLPLEFVLIHHSGLDGLLTLQESNSALLAKTGSVLGILMVPFLIVFVNSFFLMVTDRLIRSSGFRKCWPAEVDAKGRQYQIVNEWLYGNRPLNDLSNPRAPPAAV